MATPGYANVKTKATTNFRNQHSHKMSASIKMYELKPIINDFKIKLPNCMYEMKPIQNRRTISDRSKDKANGHVVLSEEKPDVFEKVKQFLKINQNLPEMAALQKRQEKILRQLLELKEQMSKIKANLNGSTQKFNSCTNGTVKTEEVLEIIINSSPDYPPYSLALIQKLLIDKINLQVSSHLHSTVPKLNENAVNLTRNLENFSSGNSEFKLNIKLIWKDVGPQTELIAFATPIFGEINILRYIARIIPALGYENSSKILEIDSFLDTAYSIAHSKTKTSRANFLQIITKKLSKSQWLCDQSMTIADYAVYSVLKQIPENEVNITLSKWLRKVEDLK